MVGKGRGLSTTPRIRSPRRLPGITGEDETQSRDTRRRRREGRAWNAAPRERLTAPLASLLHALFLLLHFTPSLLLSTTHPLPPPFSYVWAQQRRHHLTPLISYHPRLPTHPPTHPIGSLLPTPVQGVCQVRRRVRL